MLINYEPLYLFSLFDIITTVVGEYVERWTCPEGTEVNVNI